jgi:ribose 5-phosphate isomerase B
MLSEDALKKRYQTIFIACDHAGLDMKNHLIGRFPFYPWRDLGTKTQESVDFPDFAEKLCLEMHGQLESSCGILICGSGQGMAMRANRFPYIRAALCWNDEVAALARQHNNANILCLAGRLTSFPLAEKILTTFLQTDFEGGRHQRRVDKLGANS